MRYHEIFYLFAGCVLMISCQSNAHKSLDTVESLLSSQSDSALSILNRFSLEEMTTPSLQARYALLNNMALDKNYIDVKDDSLINVAVKYYLSNGSERDKMRSLYYQGLVRKNAQRYTAAIVSLEQARQIAEELMDWHYVGLINRNMAEIFNSCNNTASATQHQLKAITAFSINKEKIYADYAKYSLAVLYNNGLQYDSAKTVLIELMDNQTDETLNHFVNLCYAGILVQTEDSLQRALNIFRTTPESCFDILDYGMYALASLYNGQKDSAEFYFTKAYSLSNSLEQSASLDFLHADFDSRIGHYKAAYNNIFAAAHIQDSLTRVLLNQSLTNAQLDYYKQEAALQKRIAAQRRINLKATIGTIFLVIIILFLVFLNWRKRQDEKLKDCLIKLSDSNQINARLTGAYCYERVARLCQLANQYVFSDDDREQQITMQELKQMAKEIHNSSKFFEMLSQELNRNCNGIIDDVHSQFPSIKGENLKILTLFFAGFSAAQIAVIMGRPSSGSVRTLKSRLREVIRKSNAPDKQRFLDLLT